MTVTTLFRKYGCLIANNNRLAKEIYNSSAIICHAGTLTGLRDTSASQIGLPPASRPCIGKIAEMLKKGEHSRNNLRAMKSNINGDSVNAKQKPRADVVVGFE